MRDIVERLRKLAGWLREITLSGQHADWCDEAAAEILALRQQVEKARAQGRDEGLEEAAKVADKLATEMKTDRMAAQGARSDDSAYYLWAEQTANQIAKSSRALKSGEGV